jgi:hypothetical protein
MKIYYGIENNYIDVTTICMQLLLANDIILIPTGQSNRDRLFNC